MSFNSHCVAMLKPPESLCAKDEGVTLRKRMGQAGFEPATSLPPRVSAGWSGHAAIAPPPLAPSVATSGPEPGLNPGPKWNSFSGPESGTRMEQLFGARIGAQIKQLFGARIRDPKGTAFRGPNRGPNQTTFRGPNPGPERNSFSGPESGPESNNFSWPGLLAVDVSGGSLEATVLHICVHQPSFRGSNGIRLFGARIRDPNGTAFRGPNRGPNRTTFRGPGLLAVDVSPGTLWMPLFQFAHLCPPAIFSEPEWYTTFRGPNPGPESGTRMEQLFGARIQDPNRTTFRPGTLGFG